MSDHLRKMAKVIIANDRLVHMSRRAILDEESSSSEDEDSNESSEDDNDENDCDSVHDQSESDNDDQQYSMHEYDNHVEIVVREELDEEVEDPSVHVDQAVPNDNLQDASLVIRHKRRYRFKRRRLFEYLDEVETYEEEFKEVFRMSRVTFRELLEEIREFLPIGSSVNGKSLLPEEMLLMFLWYHTGNSFVRHDKRSHSCSHGSICKSNDLVIRAFHESTIDRKNFVHRQVRLPTPTEALEEAHDFQQKSSFPPLRFRPIVFAAVDGTHCKVQPPKAHNLDFRNRHGELSLNVMIVSGANGLIFSVNADFPGANADSPIFRASSCYRVLQYEYSPFKDAIILGDKAYQRSLPFLATPFRENQLDNPRKTEFNKAFCRARVSVECTIGKIKARFAILKDGFRFKSMQKVGRSIEALCAIHNFIVRKERQEDIDGVYTQEDVDRINAEEEPDDIINEEEVDGIETNLKLFRKYYPDPNA